ncbi:MAG: DedA family protein [Acidobacteria bacterium]|nr:DedA family protein [Acidobacteriota bacterium]
MVGYLTLFGWSFLAATVVPLGSEPALVVLIRQGYSFPAVVFVATLGNYLGACTTYGLGRAVAHVLRSETSSRTAKRATELVVRYGAPALVLSWVPIIGDAIVVAAGVARMPFLPFSLWTVLGKAVRYLAVAWGARTLL